jgi:hypothetical protein
VEAAEDGGSVFVYTVAPTKAQRAASAGDWLAGVAAHASYLGSTVIVNPLQLHNE